MKNTVNVSSLDEFGSSWDRKGEEGNQKGSWESL